MFNRKSLTYTYMRAFILFIIVPIFIIILTLNNIFINLLLKSSSDKVLMLMDKISSEIDNELRNSLYLLATQSESNDYEIIDLATQWNRTENVAKKLEISRQIDSKLNYLLNYRSEIAAVVFFFKDKGFYYYKDRPSVDDNEIRRMKWYRESLKSINKSVVAGSLKGITTNSGDKYVMSVSISPDLSKYRNDVEVVYFAVNTNIFDNLFSGADYLNSGENFLADNDGNILAGSNKALVGKNAHNIDYFKKTFVGSTKSYIEYINNKRKLITAYTIERTGWRMINVTDYNVLTSEVNKVLRYVAILSGIIIVVFLAFSVFFFRGIINPINHLIKSMKIVENGNFNVKIKETGNSEIKHLGTTFNSMVQKIKSLIDERNLKEKERIEAEIEALQSQINPHFISNTLNSIRFMAMVAKFDNIKNMAEAFIRLVSASFGRGGKFTTIESEMENLQSYIYIMQVRYSNKFSVEFEIDDEIKQCYILKLTLQPIIENAIIHGISEKEDEGLIKISGYKGPDFIEIDIKDNGIGMTKEQIKKIFEENYRNTNNGFNSMGVRNVDRRMKLNHGESYGLTINSEPDKYTKVKVIIPIIFKDIERDFDV